MIWTLIDPNGDIATVDTGRLETLTALQHLVGGYVEFIRSEAIEHPNGRPVYYVVNEDRYNEVAVDSPNAGVAALERGWANVYGTAVLAWTDTDGDTYPAPCSVVPVPSIARDLEEATPLGLEEYLRLRFGTS